jgi:hypothetical protein
MEFKRFMSIVNSDAWDRPIYALATLLDGMSQYESELFAAVDDSYTEVIPINGKYSWKRKSDGA